MKFVIPTQEFCYLINKCLSVVMAKSVLPILSNILLEAKGKELILTATDLTVSVRCYTEAKILKEGSTTIPAKPLAQLLRELTSVNIELETDACHQTTIKAGDTSVFTLKGMSKEDYPSLPDLDEAAQFSLKQDDLKKMFFSVGFSVSKEESRFALTGVFMHIKEGQITFVGTDGKRLAKAYLKEKLDDSLSGSYIVPLKAVDEIQSILTEEEKATFYLMKDKVGVKANNCLIITKLLVGDYPDITRVIPEELSTKVTLHREELISLLRQVSLFTSGSMDSVRFTFMDGELKLEANTAEIGEGKVSMAVDYQGPKIEVAFNPMYFLDVLRHSKEEIISLGITDSFNPGVIIDKDKIEKSLDHMSPLYVLMPMRLKKVTGGEK